MKVDILAIGVHPDDIELSCAGTIIKYTRKGKRVGILDLTRGELGTRGTAETRDEEAAAAAQIMGVAFRRNTRMADGFFQHSPENLKEIIRVIRYCRPEVVFNNATSDRHPDHGRASKLIADACFLSGLVKIPTVDEQGKPQEKWRPVAVYNYIQDYHIRPDFVVDISEVVAEKMQAISAYKTQFYNPDSEQPETPISGKGFIDFLHARWREMGRPAGYEFAEGFTVNRTIGVRDILDLD